MHGSRSTTFDVATERREDLLCLAHGTPRLVCGRRLRAHVASLARGAPLTRSRRRLASGLASGRRRGTTLPSGRRGGPAGGECRCTQDTPHGHHRHRCEPRTRRRARRAHARPGRRAALGSPAPTRHRLRGRGRRGSARRPRWSAPSSTRPPTAPRATAPTSCTRPRRWPPTRRSSADAERRVVDDHLVPERAVWEAAEAVAAQFEALGGYFAERARDIADVRDRIVADAHRAPGAGRARPRGSRSCSSRRTSPRDHRDARPARGARDRHRDGRAHVAHRDPGARPRHPGGRRAARAPRRPSPRRAWCSSTARRARCRRPHGRAGPAPRARSPRRSGRSTATGTPPTATASSCWRTSATRPARRPPRPRAPRASGCSAPSSGSSTATRRRRSTSRSPPTARVLARLPRPQGRRPHARRRAPTSRCPSSPATREDNPALGVRGLRTAARHPDVLDDQLTAIAQAAAGGDGRGLGDGADGLDRRRGPAVRRRVRARTGCDVAGVMIEVPSAALLAGPDPGARGVREHRHQRPHAVHDGGRPAPRRRRRAVRPRGSPPSCTSSPRPAAGGAQQGRPVGVCGEAAAEPRARAPSWSGWASRRCR